MAQGMGFWIILFMVVTQHTVAQPNVPRKTAGALYPADLVDKAKANAAAYPWASAIQKELTDRASAWLNLPDDDLWNSVFGPNISRSWMVWSDGYCPACKKDVKMYTWEMEPFSRPWKVRCPHCQEQFPTNDFAAFHQSGLDEHGVFQPSRADRSLLFHTAHPDPNDPLHRFGVDDGEGYKADGHTWRFVGAYLIYGHWKQLVHAGIVRLSEAHMATGDDRYAYKAALLLDRLADVYPSFDFSKQGLVYETRNQVRGQISTWHDACEEIRMLAQAYDQIFEAAKAQEAALTAYLSQKAARYQLSNPKRTWADVQRNIEEGLFVHTLDNRPQIESNYPRTDMARLIIKTVLHWPQNRDEVFSLLDGILQEATAVDGVSGEKGVAGYTTIAPRAVADILALYSRLEPGFLKTVYERHPVLHQTFRFHVDLMCLDEYYPQSGDSGSFAAKSPAYGGVALDRYSGVNPSMYAFLWDLYAVTNDPAFAQILFRANTFSVEGLPHTILAPDPAGFQRQVQEVIEKSGTTIPLESVNKQQWCLAILRSGTGENRRALWIDYDAGGRHSHADALNVGYFAKGLDLIPDFGYPPVGYGGWGAPKARWYTSTAAHATVVVDGKNQRAAKGAATLWANGERVRAIRVSVPEAIAGKRLERTLLLADLDERDSYVVDCLRVTGGKDHAKFFHSHFGTVTTQGLTLAPADPYGNNTEMRNFQRDTKPQPGWSADWTIEDRYRYLPADRRVHLRYVDLTPDAEASLAEAWIETAQFGGAPEWIPRVMVRRQASKAPLESTFVSVFAAYDGAPPIQRVSRLPLEIQGEQPLPDSYVGVQVEGPGGRRDICLLPDGEGPIEVIEPQNGIHFRGHLAVITVGPALSRIALGRAEWITVGGLDIRMNSGAEYVELTIEPDAVRIAAGSPENIRQIIRDGKPAILK